MGDAEDKDEDEEEGAVGLLRTKKEKTSDNDYYW